MPSITPGSILVHFLPTLGFVLGTVLLSHILWQRRSPASTLAWLLAIIVIPYVGVPLYLMLGGRKMARQSGAKRQLALPCGKNPSDLLQHTDKSAGPLGTS
jgi:cardiolipin synthase